MSGVFGPTRVKFGLDWRVSLSRDCPPVGQLSEPKNVGADLQAVEMVFLN